MRNLTQSYGLEPFRREALPMVSSPVYILRMKRTALLILLVTTQAIEIGRLLANQGTGTQIGMVWRIGLFLILPFTLALLIGLQFRWAAMVCVMYATVGLAMDIATVVQLLNSDELGSTAVINSGISGMLNFLLIVFGGRAVLDVGQELMPQESRPPSPPSPS